MAFDFVEHRAAGGAGREHVPGGDIDRAWARGGERREARADHDPNAQAHRPDPRLHLRQQAARVESVVTPNGGLGVGSIVRSLACPQPLLTKFIGGEVEGIAPWVAFVGQVAERLGPDAHAQFGLDGELACTVDVQRFQIVLRKRFELGSTSLGTMCDILWQTSGTPTARPCSSCDFSYDIWATDGVDRLGARTGISDSLQSLAYDSDYHGDEMVRYYTGGDWIAMFYASFDGTNLSYWSNYDYVGYYSGLGVVYYGWWAEAVLGP